MKKGILSIGLCLLASSVVFSQEDTMTVQVQIDTSFAIQPAVERPDPVYKLKPAVDIPVTAIGAGWSGYAFTKIYSKDNSTEAQIRALNVNDINGFDRWAADRYSIKAAENSDLLFYGSMPLPILLLLDKDIRKDAPKIAFLYVEAMAVTGLLYTGATYLSNRYRPLAYNTNVPMEERMRGGSKNSFFAGHVALVGTATFFTAKVFADYHPDSKLKYLFYGGAALATGATGYLRHRGGKHFPSDIVLGTAVGTLSGILVPHFHKNKLFKNENLSILPFTGNGTGLAVVYKIK